MKAKKRILPLLLASVLAAAGCAGAKNTDRNRADTQSGDTGGAGSSDSQSGDANTGTDSGKANAGSVDTQNGDVKTGSSDSQSGNGDTSSADAGSRVSASDLFSDRDMQQGYEKTGSAAIRLQGTGASCSSDAVKISGSTVTITDEGTYILSGVLQDGMVIVDADKSDKVQIVLNGAQINSSSSAAVYVRQADKVFLTTAQDSENTLSNGGSYEAIDENNIDAVIFSKDDLTLNGMGSLDIHAQAGHGVVSKDDLVLTGGKYNITAANHGLNGKDSVCIAGGEYEITAGKDGIHTENTDDAELGFFFISDGEFKITSEGDGISGSYFGQIEDGSFKIQAGGGAAAAVSRSGQDAGERPGAGTRQDAGARPGAGTRQDAGAGSSAGTGQDAGAGPGAGTGQDAGAGAGAGTGQDAGASQPIQVVNAVSESRMAVNVPDSPEVPDAVQPGTQSAASESDAASTKGVKAGGNLWLDGGTFVIDAADDSLHSNSSVRIAGGSYQIATGDDGIHADDAASISGGKIDISQSYEGIEGKTVDISGGDISLIADDDGLNAAGGADSSGFGPDRDSFAASEDVYISISGGTIDIKASGDGIDSNGDLTISGGETYVSGPSSGGNGSLDYNGQASITGGLFVASGAMGMVQNFGSSSTQGAMLVQTDGGAENDTISLADADGNVLVSWQAKTAYGCVIISCPKLTQGNTYTLTAGSTSSQIEMDSLIYGQGSGAGRGPGGMDGAGKGFGGMGGRKGRRQEIAGD